MTEQITPSPKSTIKPGALGGLVDVKDVHINVSQALIIITEDKVRNHLSKHLNKVEKRKGWIAPLGILITIIITLITSDFKQDSFIFPSATWEAIFVISGLISLGWLIYSIIQALKSESIEDLIDKIKKESK